MRTIILITLFFMSFGCSKPQSSDFTNLKDGDIIFHTSTSSQSKMLKEVTNSELTHVGIIFFKDGKPFVIEAVQPVKITPLQSFINRGENSEYKIMRPNFNLSNDDKKKMYSYAKKQLGKNYDSKFQWSDNKMYCSELVWKIYKEIGVELCEVKQFSDYDLDNSLAVSAINKRYKNSNFNLSEKVVAPSDLFNSDKLKVIVDTY